MVTGGSLRAGPPAGLLRKKELAAVLPFGNRVVCVSLSGTLLRMVLEHGVDGMVGGRGTLLHVSGLHYTADTAGAPGRRVARTERMGSPLIGDWTYTAAVSNYLLAGGDGFDFTGSVPGAELLDVDALAAYLRQAESPVRAPASGGLEMASPPEP